jgi:O-antigen/teichoic acid export membrane protein
VATRAVRVRPARWGGKALEVLRNPLYRSGYALVANTAGTAAVGFAYWAVAAHLYDREAVGRSSALVSALIFLSSFAQLNLATTLPRFLPEFARSGRSSSRLIAYCYGASSLTAVVAGIGFVTVLPRLSSQWQFLGRSAPLAAVFVAATVIWGIFALEDAALTGLHRTMVVPVENTVYGVGKLLLLASIALLLPSTGIFVSWVVPLVAVVPVINWLIFRRFLKHPSPHLMDPAPGVTGLRPREVIRFASVDYVGTIFGQTYGNLLPLLVLSALGAAANGAFYVAYTIASALGLVADNFATSLLVGGAAAPHRLAELTRGTLARCGLVVVPGAALLLLAPHLILAIYGGGYVAHASTLLGLLAVGAIPYSLVMMALSLDRIDRRVGRAAWTQAALAALVLAGSWLLLKKLGINGVGVAWAAGNLVVAIVRSPTIVGAARRPAARHRAGRSSTSYRGRSDRGKHER